MREIKKVIENSEGKLIIFEDEKATLAAKAYEGYLWRRKRVKIETPQEVKGRIELFGAYIPKEEKVKYRTYERMTSEEFIDFLKYLKRLYHERGLIMILDNRSIHKSQAVKEALEKIEGVELKYLPTNAPWLNPIEAIFSSLHRACIAGMKFERVKEIRGKIRSFFKRKNEEGVRVNHQFWSKILPPVLVECI